MRGAQSRKCTATIGSVFEGDLTLKKAIRRIEDQYKNNTEGKLRLWIELFDDF
jgi:hypothetical protein